jgi:hypothetical protein
VTNDKPGQSPQWLLPRLTSGRVVQLAATAVPAPMGRGALGSTVAVVTPHGCGGPRQMTQARRRHPVLQHVEGGAVAIAGVQVHRNPFQGSAWSAGGGTAAAVGEDYAPRG